MQDHNIPNFQETQDGIQTIRNDYVSDEITLDEFEERVDFYLEHGVDPVTDDIMDVIMAEVNSISKTHEIESVRVSPTTFSELSRDSAFWSHPVENHPVDFFGFELIVDDSVDVYEIYATER